MTTDQRADHTATDCAYPWCHAHRPCTCPYASTQPHPRAGCRYRRDDDQADDDHDDRGDDDH